MRKTLVAIAVVTSVVLLQTPAWAPNIYLEQVGGQTNSTTNPGRKTVKVDVTSPDCKRKTLSVTFEWGETLDGTTSGNGKYRKTLGKIPSDNGEVTRSDITSATCDGEVLALTGAASARLLALGTSLLLIGVLLVLSGRRRPLVRRGRCRPSPDRRRQPP